MTAKGRDTRENDLALNGGYAAGLADRLAKSASKSLLCAEVERFEECGHDEEGGGDVEVQGIVHALNREISEQSLAQFAQRSCWANRTGGPMLPE